MNWLNTLFDKLSTTQVSFPSFSQVFSRVREVFYAPQADITATILTSAFLLNILAILLVVVLWIVLKRHDSRVAREQMDEFDEQLMELDPENAPEIIRTSRINARFFAIMVVIVTTTLLVVGVEITTSQTSICTSCHKTSEHVAIVKNGPHKNTSCVDCHESSNFMVRISTSFFPRIGHILKGTAAANAENSAAGSSATAVVAGKTVVKLKDDDYGAIDTGSCLGCHKDIQDKTTTNATAGIRMSHKEPLDAGMRCTRCHMLSSKKNEIITEQNMNTCLECHNDAAATTDCTACHTKDTASAAAARSMPDAGSTLVSTDYNCYSCHDPAPCDSCHGMRLPHSKLFMTTGYHAYPGAVSIWAGSKGKCTKCHNSEHRDCNGQCHQDIYKHHMRTEPNFKVTHASGNAGFDDVVMGCDTCHGGVGYNPGGDSDVCKGCHLNKNAQ